MTRKSSAVKLMKKSAATSATHKCSSSPLAGCFRTKFPVFVTVVVSALHFHSKKEAEAGKGQNAVAQVLPNGNMPALAVRWEPGERFLPKALSFMCLSFCAVSSPKVPPETGREEVTFWTALTASGFASHSPLFPQLSTKCALYDTFLLSSTEHNYPSALVQYTAYSYWSRKE